MSGELHFPFLRAKERKCNGKIAVFFAHMINPLSKNIFSTQTMVGMQNKNERNKQKKRGNVGRRDEALKNSSTHYCDQRISLSMIVRDRQKECLFFLPPFCHCVFSMDFFTFTKKVLLTKNNFL